MRARLRGRPQANLDHPARQHDLRRGETGGAYAIIPEEIYVRAQSFLRKIETGIAWTAGASVRQRVGEKDLRQLSLIHI